MKPLVIILIITCSIFSRLVPHLPNFSPEIVFTLYLGMKSNKILAYLNIFLMAAISDILLSLTHPWPAFGDWTLFTYSALFIIGTVGLIIKNKGYGIVFVNMTGGSALFYWIWTNAGTWLTSGMYSHTLSGLIDCYVLALPFLATSVAASIIWCAAIIACEFYVPTTILKGES